MGAEAPAGEPSEPGGDAEGEAPGEGGEAGAEWPGRGGNAEGEAPLERDAEWAEALQERAVEWAESPEHEGEGPLAPSASGPDALERTNAVVREHLRGLLEALLFLSSEPMAVAQLAGLAQADRKVVRELLAELREFYRPRGLRLDEIAGGWIFRTNPAYAPFLRELTGQKPIKMTRAQIETLAIVAYRQPVTRPEIDEVRGVDSGPVLKALLERDLVRIMGKKEEPGRPLLYGTTPHFLQFFSLNSLRDLPTLREFTELSDDSKQAFTRETGEDPPAGEPVESGLAGGEGHLNAAGPEAPATGEAPAAAEAPADGVGEGEAKPGEGASEAGESGEEAADAEEPSEGASEAGEPGEEAAELDGPAESSAVPGRSTEPDEASDEGEPAEPEGVPAGEGGGEGA
ncbi:MAG TPA: SMC-Scp complex subunit ScpB, partial [Polyangiaceae bacterium]|nr:SMC-Scp complex subunit ScpB [Polyangiaceae bacterium]